MKKAYWFVIITYLAMQLSSFIGVPIFVYILSALGSTTDRMALNKAIAYWSVFSFFLALLLILFFMRHDLKEEALARDKASLPISIAWAVSGIFLALFAQSLASMIEQNLLGIRQESANTQDILKIIKAVPLMVIVSSIFGPILEEIVFRKIIFGALYKRFNFFLSALISSVIFGLAHMEMTHLLLYSAMGFTFAFLYVRTKRIIVPIFAHVAMNSLVVIVQFYSPEIENYLNNTQSFIGGFL